MTVIDTSSTSDVFINCPFDPEYSSILEAIIFVVYACGFRARSTREVDDSSQNRIEKIYSIIEECRYSIHDISRTELDLEHNLPRFNMPLELGIFLGSKRFGGPEHETKRALILDTEEFRYQKYISDIAGMDICAHGNDARLAVRRVRDWLKNVSRRKLPGAAELLTLRDRFEINRPEIVEKYGDETGSIPYVDYEDIVTNWLAEAPR